MNDPIIPQIPPESAVPAPHRRRVPRWFFPLVGFAILTVLAAAYIQVRQTSHADAGTTVPVLTVPEPAAPELPLPEGPAKSLANADYYSRVRDGFIADKTTFIDVDLSAMKLRVYKDGAVAKEIDVLTKGREGSWWETPAGLYQVEAKEPNHFSSIGHVYQPWSMVFQGNFFIHGWPYEPDGTPVSSTYSGGCIRLSTPDAKAVYDLVSVHTPVLVYEKDFTSDGFTYPVVEALPTVAADEYLVADLKSNSILVQKDIEAAMPIASVTKLVTSLVGAEYINLDKSITIKPEMIVETSKPRLFAGQEITVYNLLFPLLTESSNEAAEAVARTIGKNYFVTLMNKKAKAINMTSTAFVDPSGAGDGNVSNAEDLFSLAKYIYNNRSFVFNISSGKLTGSAYGESFYTDLQNFNKVPGVTAKFIGGKIGKTTAAEETYVGVFNETLQGETRPIVVIVLHSPDAYGDTKALLEYVEANYK